MLKVFCSGALWWILSQVCTGERNGVGFLVGILSGNGITSFFNEQVTELRFLVDITKLRKNKFTKFNIS